MSGQVQVYDPEEIGPQPGPQSLFNATPADIAFYGGAAGGGKSWSLLFEPLRHKDNPYFNGTVFRRTSLQIRNPGGLWDESKLLYNKVNGEPHESFLRWSFPSGFYMKFSGLEYDDSVYNYDGSQMPYIAFDELIHFSEFQFWYLHSRNRSQSGVPGYIRAATNPDPDSWVRRFIDWYIGPDGYPIPNRSGKIRWFIRRKDEIHWADSKAEIHKKFGKGNDILPQSFTFIPAKLEDNKILMMKDPAYKAKLMGLSEVERKRLYEGNWNIRATAGSFFKREWFPIIDQIPGGWQNVTRAWDRAATEVNPTNHDPDWTRGVKIYSYPNGKWVIADLKSLRASPGSVEKFIKTVAQHDGQGVRIKGYQDPGSAGVKEAEDFMALLAGFDVEAVSVSEKKALRAKPLSRQCEYGNVSILRGEWNEELFREFENFSEDEKEYAHDDIVDAASLAFADLTGGLSMADVNDGLAAAFGLQNFRR